MLGKRMLFALGTYFKTGNGAGAAFMRAAVFCSAIAIALPAVATPLQMLCGVSAPAGHVRKVNSQPGQIAGQDNGGSERREAGEKPYTSRLVKDGGSITLRGNVPSEDDKKTIQGVIAATFPTANFVDKAKIDKDVPSRDDWLAGMNFALRQLAKLERGTAHVRNNEVSFEGAAQTEQDFRRMQQRLREEVPNGVILGEVALKPPSVSPFVWLAQMQAGSVSLSGHVPLELDNHLFIYAKSLFGSFQVSNSMALAVGAPDDWLNAAKVSLNILSMLEQGTVIVTDRLITVDGVLGRSYTVENVRALREQLPKGFKLETSVLAAAAETVRSGATEEVSGPFSPFRLERLDYAGSTNSW